MPYVNHQGVAIYYEVYGQGPPLMLQHGGFSDMSVWKDFGYVEHLQEQYMVILMDARGHGQSEKLYEPTQYVYPLMAADVIAVLDHLKVDKVHFWGWSMGGYTAFALAKHYPARLRSLIIGGAGPYNDSDPNEPGEFVELLHRGVDEGIEVIVEGIRTWNGGTLVPQAEARLRRMDPRAHLACHQAFAAVPSLISVLPKMTMPCLVYIGEYDGPELVREYVQQMPNASLLILPGRRHGDTALAVDVLVPSVLEFLASL
jgi:pimeloyl-ACP methyl ester carboxylesterase